MEYVWNLNPIALSAFGLEIRWYGIVYVAGFYLGQFWGWKILNKLFKKPPLSYKQFEALLFSIFIGGIIGGRLGHFLFFYPETIWQNPLQIFKIWEGGMAIQGGLIGALLSGIIWIKRHKAKISLLQFTHILTLPLVLTLFFGRIANFINGELIGQKTDQPFGVIFPHYDEFLRHPVVLYEASIHLIIFFVLLAIFYFRPLYFSRSAFALFLGLYGFGRFWVEYLKLSPAGFGGLTSGQWICLVMIGSSVYLLLQQKKTP